MKLEKVAHKHGGRIEEILKVSVADPRTVADYLDRVKELNSEQCARGKLILSDKKDTIDLSILFQLPEHSSMNTGQQLRSIVK